MNYRHTISTTIIISLSFFISSTANARFKCWTNSDGVKECGQNVPPEYAQQGHEEVNSHGITVDKQERAKTEAEIAEEKRLAEEQKEAARLQAEKERQDRVLLETFSTVEDINLTRDGKIASIEAQIGLSKKRIEKLQTELDLLIARAALLERKGKSPSEQLLNDINSLKRQINTNEQFIEDKHKEQDLIREEYASYTERFNTLKK